MVNECPVCGKVFVSKRVCPRNEEYGGCVFHGEEITDIVDGIEYTISIHPCKLSHVQWDKVCYKDFAIEKLI